MSRRIKVPRVEYVGLENGIKVSRVENAGVEYVGHLKSREWNM